MKTHLYDHTTQSCQATGFKILKFKKLLIVTVIISSKASITVEYFTNCLQNS